MALTDKLSAIGTAIRNKTGKTALMTLDEMPTEIAGISTGSGSGLPEEALTITGDCSSRFSHNGWNWFIENYGNQLTTTDITACSSMFVQTNNIEEIPFTINVKDCTNFYQMFSSASSLTKCPKIRGTIKWGTSTTFSGMLTSTSKLRYVDDLFTPEMFDGFETVKVTSPSSSARPININYMYSLRTVPIWFYKQRLNEESTVYPSRNYCLYYSLCTSCYALDEITNIPVWKCAGAVTFDMFSYALSYVNRAKNITFETNTDGSPIVTKWKSQTINLTSSVGYGVEDFILQYNCGITADKKVTDDATYQALKDDPDWFTANIAYSRYNHNSAVATINSLPDTSAYLATAGGTNTIKFKGVLGSSTDGGAINTLTAEEIAVATAKGWTVTIS